MKHNRILYAIKACGCVSLRFTIEPDTNLGKITEVLRLVQQLGFKPEWLSAKEPKERPWDCPEHGALKSRVAREKVAHQEGLALKG